jgi:hypothetical protein
MTNMTPSPDTLHPACESSLNAGEQLFATATRVDVWLALEYNAAWGAKALDESDLSPEVIGFLNQQTNTIPNARFQFIKQGGTGEGFTFYVACANRPEPTLYRFNLAAYEDLLKLDIPAIVAGDTRQPSSDERLFLVCVNGKRDMCCARHGLALYQAMSEHAGESVWQTTHLGGHRFAATMVCLPHGVFYGRVQPGEGAEIVDAYRTDRIILERYRGAGIYDAPVQAADYFLRKETRTTGLTAFAPVETLVEGDNRWWVRLRERAGVAIHSVRVRAEPTVEVYQNSRDAQPTRVMQYFRAE